MITVEGEVSFSYNTGSLVQNRTSFVQRLRRRWDRINPRTRPYRRTAVTEYSEHVGR